jgi:23S rRNA (guanosine2251-2'-O)-methyltransferase
MSGNSGRRGAVRRPGSKKGATVGSGGQRRQGLSGKGPTPKAAERTGHPAARKAAAVTRRTQPSGSRDGGGGRGRRSGGVEAVAGRNAVLEALQAEVPARTLYVAARIDADDRVRETLRLAADRGLALLEAPRSDLDRLSGGAVHQGLVLQIPPYQYAHPQDLVPVDDAAGPALLVALDGVTDPRNLGAVLRSVGAFGGHGVVVPERRAAGMTAGAWKASAGAAARIPVARAANLTRALTELKKAGLFVIGLDADGVSPLSGLDVAADPVVLVVGAEGRGLSRLVRQTCDIVVSIPMASGTESLNAGVAAGIALYEIARLRG